jgi:hypothetical protein
VGKTPSNKSTAGNNAMDDNTKWKGCLTHIAISNIKTTLPSMGGQWTSCNNFLTTIGGSCS